MHFEYNPLEHFPEATMHESSLPLSLFLPFLSFVGAIVNETTARSFGGSLERAIKDLTMYYLSIC